jgi:hypothetical protein
MQYVVGKNVRASGCANSNNEQNRFVEHCFPSPTERMAVSLAQGAVESLRDSGV